MVSFFVCKNDIFAIENPVSIMHINQGINNSANSCPDEGNS